MTPLNIEFQESTNFDKLKLSSIVFLAASPKRFASSGLNNSCSQKTFSSNGSLLNKPFLLCVIISGIMQLLVLTIAQPHAIASISAVGTGECRDVLRNIDDV